MYKFDGVKTKTTYVVTIIASFILMTLTFFSACADNNLSEPKAVEIIPEISLTTLEGKITSTKFLEDSKGEFLLFISPN